MNKKDFDVIVIGAGPAGLAAALGAKRNGAVKVAVVERDKYSGGILQQCIHNGFGLHLFNTDLTGPEYAEKFIEEAEEAGIEIILETMVLELNPSSTDDKNHSVLCVSRSSGLSRSFSSFNYPCNGLQGKNKGKHSNSRDQACRNFYSRNCPEIYQY